MNKEELEKEVKEYISHNQMEGAKDFVVYKVRVGENAFAYVVEHKNELYCSDWIKMYEGTEQECYRVVGYLDSAKPREKQIQVLGERCLQLQKDKGELIDKVRDLEEKLANADYQLEGRDLEIKELKAQLEREKNLSQCMSDHNEQLKELIKKMKQDLDTAREEANRQEQWELYSVLNGIYNDNFEVITSVSN